MKRKRKFRQNALYFMLLLVLIGIVFLNTDNVGNMEQQSIMSSNNQKEEAAKDYQQCLSREYSTEMNTPEFNEQLQEIEKNLKSYNVTALFNSYYKNFRYTFQEEITYYGASLYKLIDINYMMEKSNNNEIDLDNTPNVKYWMSKILDTSNNEAHRNLASYIGLENLRAYAKSLGATHVMDYRYFGILNVHDVELYMNNIYKLMNVGNENSDFLKKWMNNGNQNSLNIDEVSYYHKFGMFDQFYHNAGIAITDKPYLLIILSETRFLDEKSIFNKMSLDFYKLNLELEKNQLKYCDELIYGGEHNE